MPAVEYDLSNAMMDQLPLELLRKVLQHVDCESTLALAHSSKSYQNTFQSDSNGYLLRRSAERTSSFLHPTLKENASGSGWIRCMARFEQTTATIRNFRLSDGRRSATKNSTKSFDTLVSLAMVNHEVWPKIPTFDTHRKSIRGWAQDGAVAYRLWMNNGLFEVINKDEAIASKERRHSVNSAVNDNQRIVTLFADDAVKERTICVLQVLHEKYTVLELYGSKELSSFTVGGKRRLVNPRFAYSNDILFVLDDGYLRLYRCCDGVKVAGHTVDYIADLTSMAVTQTHMWIVHAYTHDYRTVFAIDLTIFIERNNDSIRLDDWSRVVDIDIASFNSSWRFGSSTFYGRYMALLSGNQCFVINLASETGTYYVADTHSHGQWVLDKSGVPVFIEERYIGALVHAYISQKTSGKCHVSELVDRPHMYHI